MSGSKAGDRAAGDVAYTPVLTLPGDTALRLMLAPHSAASGVTLPEVGTVVGALVDAIHGPGRGRAPEEAAPDEAV